MKARAHSLSPVVQIGNRGLTDAVVTEIANALEAHELIKVRAASAERDELGELAESIATRTGAATVATIGKVMVFWRKRPEE